MKFKCVDCFEFLRETNFGNSNYLECPECELCVKIYVGDDE